MLRVFVRNFLLLSHLVTKFKIVQIKSYSYVLFAKSILYCNNIKQKHDSCDRYYSVCYVAAAKFICVVCDRYETWRTDPALLLLLPSVSLMCAGSHFDGEIFDATYTSHKTFEKREGPSWNGVRDEPEREECSLTFEPPPYPGKEAFYCLRTGSLIRRQMFSEGTRAIGFFCCEWVIELLRNMRYFVYFYL